MASDHGREIGERRRRDRLVASLRENLKRRKAQQRARASETGAPPSGSADDHAASESSPPSYGIRKV
jgi:hypothetical protein